VALKDKTIKKIQESIRLFKLFLRFTNLGPQTLTVPELKDLARAGYIGKNSSIRTAMADAYHSAHLDVAENVTGAPRSVREGSVSYLERMAALYSDKMADSLGHDVFAAVHQEFMPFINREEGKHVYDLLADPANKGKYLGNKLNGIVKNWNKRYKMIISTESARSANFGAADAIIHNNPNKSADDIIVFKRGTHTRAESCKICQEFWFMPDGSPKLYTMKDLLAFGDNVGRKQKQWTPSLGPTHPFCRHTLSELKPGYGFDGNGAMTYVSKDHSELDKQKK
jgi:hypothetical protein